MKNPIFCLCMLAMLFFSFSLSATVLIDPAGDGGFELGATFADNGWTHVYTPPDQTNRWYLGTAPAGYSGQRCAFISNDGVSYNYALTSSTVFLYKDISFPADETDIRLSFDYKGVGQAQNGFLRVLLVSTSTSLYPNNPPAESNAVGYKYYNLCPEWTKTGINIPASAAGTVKRLVFMWKNTATGYNPPAAIDNVSLSSQAASPLAGAYFIDSTQPTGDPYFHDFVDALLALNGSGISANTSFLVMSGQEYLNFPPVITATGTADAGIEFRKFSEGNRPVLKCYGAGGTSSMFEGALAIAGGDYFTFNGIDVQIAGGVETAAGIFTYPLEYGYYFYAASATNGAQHNTVKNCRIVMNRNNINTRCVYQHYNVNPSSATGANSYNSYLNLTVENSRDGIRLSSVSTDFPDLDCQISHCTIGADTPDNLGSNSGNSSCGIAASYQSGLVISYNEIRNLTDPSNNAEGIDISYGKGEIRIFNNFIHDIRAAAEWYVLESKGMYLHLAYPGPHSIYVYNNVITGLSCGYTGSPITADTVSGTMGIQMLGSCGNYYIDFNSIRVDGLANANSVGIYVDNTYNNLSWDGINRIRNNVIANYTVAQSSCKHYGMYFEDHATLLGQAGSVSDHNVIYIDQAQNGYPVRGASALYSTLAAWTTASGYDANSYSADPLYVSAADLHIPAGSGSQALNHGSYFSGAISWINDDIDGEIRNVSTPDIGADEAYDTGLEVPVVQISLLYGTIYLQWEAVTGAAHYRIESSAEPYTGYSVLDTTVNTFYSLFPEEKRFFKVIAVTE